ncbi:MAG: hypothetical protein IJB45_02180 [Clostridia bacterium]|nr:hypothetical protein [Clostridia bacterium]
MKKAKAILSLLMALIMALGCFTAAFAADAATEDSDNNTIATADALVIGGSITGAFDSAEDVDYFAVAVEKAGLLTVTIEHNTNESTLGYFNVEVVDADEKTVTSLISKGNEAKVTSTAFGVGIGTYYVKVTPITFDRTLGYTVSVAEDNTSVAEKEPNNAPADATAIDKISAKGSTKKYAGYISASSDVDYYKVSTAKDGYIYFYIYNHENSSASYTAELVSYYTTNTTEKVLGTITIDADDEYAMSASIGVKGGVFYYLMVTSADGTTGGYEIKFYYGEDSNTEVEYNDETGAATNLAASNATKSNALAGAITHASDVDYYRVNLSDKYGYKLNLKAYVADMKTAAQWKVAVYAGDNPTGSALLEATATDSAAAELSLNDLEAGIYYVKITAGTDFNSDLYKIELIETEKEEGPKSFFERLKEIKWANLLSTFAGWIGQVDFAAVVKAIYQSIMGLMGAL